MSGENFSYVPGDCGYRRNVGEVVHSGGSDDSQTSEDRVVCTVGGGDHGGPVNMFQVGFFPNANGDGVGVPKWVGSCTVEQFQNDNLFFQCVEEFL